MAAPRGPPTHGGNLRAWLTSLVRNTARTMRRSDRRRAQREVESAGRHEVGSASDALERAELARELVATVLALHEPYKTVLVLAYFENLAPNAIARELGARNERLRPGHYYLSVWLKGRRLAKTPEFDVERGKETTLEYVTPR
jgi:RNA polymerase sigma factor (sigma-70 family)